MIRNWKNADSTGIWTRDSVVQSRAPYPLRHYDLRYCEYLNRPHMLHEILFSRAKMHVIRLSEVDDDGV